MILTLAFLTFHVGMPKYLKEGFIFWLSSRIQSTTVETSRQEGLIASHT